MINTSNTNSQLFLEIIDWIEENLNILENL